MLDFSLTFSRSVRRVVALVMFIFGVRGVPEVDDDDECSRVILACEATDEVVVLTALGGRDERVGDDLTLGGVTCWWREGVEGGVELGRPPMREARRGRGLIGLAPFCED